MNVALGSRPWRAALPSRSGRVDAACVAVFRDDGLPSVMPAARSWMRRTLCGSGEPRADGQQASVLIIVLWVCFGLVSLTLYFAHSMSLEVRASGNRVEAVEAGLAIDGAARYVTNLLAQLETPGEVPDKQTYAHEAVPVGQAYFWFIGRPQAGEQPATDQTVFGLVDEASKVNLNTAPLEMLEALPGMTEELAAAIVDWRDEDSDITDQGAEDDRYMRLNPAYRCKNGPFESVGELRLVLGADLELIFGEDANLNGVLDPNENDGERSPPMDNRNGRLERGLLEYVTVYSRESNQTEDGESKINIAAANLDEFRTLLQETLGNDRAAEIMVNLAAVPPPLRNSLLALYKRSGMTESEWSQIESRITANDEDTVEGLINVNTAPEEVLAAIPGIGTEHASALVAKRRSSAQLPTSLAWVADLLEDDDITQAGPFLTAHSYQFTADVAAVGRHGHGYRRARFVFDTSQGFPSIIHRDDLSHMGWALGWRTRQLLAEAATGGRLW